MPCYDNRTSSSYSESRQIGELRDKINILTDLLCATTNHIPKEEMTGDLLDWYMTHGQVDKTRVAMCQDKVDELYSTLQRAQERFDLLKENKLDVKQDKALIQHIKTNLNTANQELKEEKLSQNEWTKYFIEQKKNIIDFDSVFDMGVNIGAYIESEGQRTADDREVIEQRAYDTFKTIWKAQ